MRITNNSKALQGVHVAGGGVRYIQPGASANVDLDEAALKLAERLPFLTIEAVAESEPAAGALLEAVHRGGGRYFVMDGDKALTEAMSKADAEAFNAMSDDDKAAFVKKD